MTIVLPTMDDTVELGRNIGRSLRAGDLVLLDGALGAGKTVLAKGVADGMGVSGRVSSPTFVIARTHPPCADGVSLVHVDAYRIGGDLSQLDDLDFDTDLASSAVVVEWGADVGGLLSEDYLLVRLQRREDDVRLATIEQYGTWASRCADACRVADGD